MSIETATESVQMIEKIQGVVKEQTRLRLANDFNDVLFLFSLKAVDQESCSQVHD